MGGLRSGTIYEWPHCIFAAVKVVGSPNLAHCSSIETRMDHSFWLFSESVRKQHVEVFIIQLWPEKRQFFE